MGSGEYQSSPDLARVKPAPKEEDSTKSSTRGKGKLLNKRSKKVIRMKQRASPKNNSLSVSTHSTANVTQSPVLLQKELTEIREREDLESSVESIVKLQSSNDEIPNSAEL